MPGTSHLADRMMGALLILLTLVALALLGVVLTGVHLANTLRPARARAPRGVELSVYLVGIPLTALLLALLGWNEDWPQPLVSGDDVDPMHTPVAGWSLPTVLTLAIVGLAGLAFLRAGTRPADGTRLAEGTGLSERTRVAEGTEEGNEPGDRPPLLTVLGLAATYLGAAVCLAWLVQVVPHAVPRPFTWPVCLVPFAFVLSTVGVTREAMTRALTARTTDMAGSDAAEGSGAASSRERLAAWTERTLHRVALWPLVAFALAWPLWGVLTAVLVLAGQRPDAAVQAFLDTSDWTLSTRHSPPMVSSGGHYLCTVAAGGHRRLVRPQRRGVRHGGPVVVNRQLSVANAFEEVLGERLPRTHRAVRGFYDRCGLPVAEHVTTAWRADVVYLVMKPAEWLFLAVLYATDRHPERRIARQYLPGAPARTS